MKSQSLYLILMFTLFSPVSLASDEGAVNEGKTLYMTHCSSCHGNAGGMDMSKRLAPPIAAVRMHYIGPYPDRASFIMAVSGWVEKQDEKKSLMRGAIRRFNLMPPVYVSTEDAVLIAGYIYDGEIDKPAGFDEHVEKMHGKQE